MRLHILFVRISKDLINTIICSQIYEQMHHYIMYKYMSYITYTYIFYCISDNERKNLLKRYILQNEN